MEKLLNIYTGYTQSTTDSLQTYIENQGYDVVNIVYGNDEKRSRKLITYWYPKSEIDFRQLANVSTNEATCYDLEYYNKKVQL